MSVARSRSHAAHFPLTLSQSPMEFAGRPSSSGACGFLAVPGLSTLELDDDDGEVLIGIRPKSSPLPRRKSSVTDDEDDDSEPEPPPSSSRRVSFADAKGLNLVQVKEFDKWDVPLVPGYDSNGEDEEEYYITPLNFPLQWPTEELSAKVQEQKVELDTVELVPGTTTLKGVIRVLNISFNKAVYVRTTLDSWHSHFDLLAQYIPGCSDGTMDSFSFKLTLVPPFKELGTRVEFCLRYETPLGTFWGNNNNCNYVFLCHQRIKEQKENLPQENVHKKSCLKTVSQNVDTVQNMSVLETSQQENLSTDVSNHGADVKTVKTNQTVDSPKSTSEENRRNSAAENRRNYSRSSHRKAARMARVRDYFSQRNVTGNDSESDASLTGTTQTAGKENLVEKHSDVQSLSEGNIKSVDSLFDSDSLATSEKTALDVQRETSVTNDYASNNKTEKSENISGSDSDALTGVKSDSPDNPGPSNDELVSAEHAHQNINKSLCKAEGRRQKRSMSYECANSAGRPLDSLVSQNSSYAFGTVVAPLYHQVFVRPESESKSLGDTRNPVCTTLSHHTERRGTNSAQSYLDNIQTQETNQDSSLCNDICTKKEGSTSVVSFDSSYGAQPLQDPNSKFTRNPHLIKPNMALYPQPENSLSSDLLSPSHNLNLEGEAQEANITHDLQGKTAKAQAQLQENAYLQTCDINMKQTLSQKFTMTNLEKPFLSFEPSHSVPVGTIDQQTSNSAEELNKEHDFGDAATRSTTLHNDAAAKENEKVFGSCFESIEQKHVMKTQEKSINTEKETKGDEDEAEHSKTEVVGEKDESVTKAATSNCHMHSDMFVKLKDKDALENKEIIFSEKVEHDEVLAAVSEEGFDLADTKNWEIMVEEEESDLFTEDESNKLILETEDIEAVEANRIGSAEEQLRGLEPEVQLEEMGDKRDSLVKEDKDESTVELGGIDGIEEETGHIVKLEDSEGKAEDAVDKRKDELGDNDTREVKAGNALTLEDNDRREDTTGDAVTEAGHPVQLGDSDGTEDQTGDAVEIGDNERNGDKVGVAVELEDNDKREDKAAKELKLEDNDKGEDKAGGTVELDSDSREDKAGDAVELGDNERNEDKVGDSVEFEDNDKREDQAGDAVELEDSDSKEAKDQGPVQLEDSDETEDKTGDAAELRDNVRAKETQFKEVLKELTVKLGEERHETELDQEREFAQMQEANIQENDTGEGNEIEGEGEMNVSDVKQRDQEKAGENLCEQGEMLVLDAGEEEITVSEGDEEERLDKTHIKVEDNFSAWVNNVQEDVDSRHINKENTGVGQNAHTPPDMNQEYFQSNNSITHDRSKAARDEDKEGGLCILTDEPETDQTSDGSSSSESGSDDEVELYMHCLRAVHSFSQATKDHIARDNKEFGVCKRLSGSSGRLLSTSLPSISESLDEEQHLSQLQDSHEDAETADFQPTAPALSVASGEENINTNTSWWKETFSISNISKTLLFTTLLVLFLAVAYHYDFLACFGLYLISVVWLCCHGERQPVKNNNRIG